METPIWCLDNWKAAHEKYLREWPYLQAGRTSPPEFKGNTIKRVINRFPDPGGARWKLVNCLNGSGPMMPAFAPARIRPK